MTSAYASTAYDSTQPRTLSPMPESGPESLPFLPSWCPPLDTHGIHCGEFLTENYSDYVEGIAPLDYENLNVSEAPVHERYFWGTHFSAHNVLMIATYFFLFACIGPIGLGVALLFVEGFISAISWGVGGFIICYGLHRLGLYLLTTRWFEQVYKIRLSRKTGMIGRLIKGQWVEHPFDEYLGCNAKMGHYNLSTSHRLALCHRYSKLRVTSGEHYHPWEVQQEWEFWQQYMDVSLPLPDVPQFEPFRRHDPVTVAYDKKWGRPEDFWKSMDPKAYGMMFAAARRAAQTYPWGLSREQALAQGWQPSGFDQEALRETWYQAVADGCRFAVEDKKLLLVPPEEYAREHNVGPGVLLG